MIFWHRSRQTLDPLDVKSFQPISNLSFLSKLTERLVVNRFNSHVGKYNQLPLRQSAYSKYHSTETAVTIVHNNIVRAIDAGDVSAFVLLDLSAAFDTVDHGVLLDVLNLRFGIVDRALAWFRSFLSNRTQSFCVASGTSTL